MKTKKIKLPKLECFKKLWKTKKALEWEDHKELWQHILKEYWTRCCKPQWSITWKDLADRVFSEYVRLHYADKDGMCVCVTCNTKLWEDNHLNSFAVGNGNLRATALRELEHDGWILFELQPAERVDARSDLKRRAGIDSHLAGSQHLAFIDSQGCRVVHAYISCHRVNVVDDEFACAFYVELARTVDQRIRRNGAGDIVFIGRSYMDAPNVDGFVFVHSKDSYLSGEFVDVMITQAKEYDLVGEAISELD